MPPRKPPPKTEKPKLAPVTTLFETNFRNIPDTLRVIAQQIESGELGEVVEGAVVLFGQKLDIYGLGSANHDGGSTHLLLSSAANKLTQRIIHWGDEEE